MLKCLLLYKEIEAAQKAVTETPVAADAGRTRTSSTEEEVSSTPEVLEKPIPTPDYAAGLLPSNPPPTPAPATPLAPIPLLAPIKEVTRVVMMPAPARAPATPATTAASTAPAPAQVVRLVTAQAGTGTSVSTPTVYRLVQPATTTSGQPAPVTPTTATVVAKPTVLQNKARTSVALMLTV